MVTWWTRLLSAVVSGDIANQDEQYLAHQTSQDYLFNALGQGAWGALFPLLTVVCSQLVGIEQAGLFSMAFVVATLLLFIAQYGVRTYQVSDIAEQ
ncbi:MAG: lipopolysaccharide biosynthesis protein, partial [Atopobium sp.]|nr:lipopolysaccharide biosynthesis protein [Atopobium sp.]